MKRCECFMILLNIDLYYSYDSGWLGGRFENLTGRGFETLVAERRPTKRLYIGFWI